MCITRQNPQVHHCQKKIIIFPNGTRRFVRGAFAPKHLLLVTSLLPNLVWPPWEPGTSTSHSSATHHYAAGVVLMRVRFPRSVPVHSRRLNIELGLYRISADCEFYPKDTKELVFLYYRDWEFFRYIRFSDITESGMSEFYCIQNEAVDCLRGLVPFNTALVPALTMPRVKKKNDKWAELPLLYWKWLILMIDEMLALSGCPLAFITE